MSRIFGLSDLKKKDENEKEQEYFAGGLDQRGGGSGQNVIGPNDPSSLSDKIAQRAKIDSTAKFVDEPVAENRNVTLYRNGFTLDDGPLRDFDSPENRDFMAAITDGRVPAELSLGGRDVGINFFDKHEEDYVAPPPPAYVAFSGGSVLGGVAISSGALIVTPELLASLPTSPSPVNESQPITTLQIRTLNGQRLRIRLFIVTKDESFTVRLNSTLIFNNRINQSATLVDLVVTIKSQYTTTDSYVLTAGFPPKDLEDGSATIAAAGLLNAAITLKKC